MANINILGKSYEIIDAKERMTVADSFVKKNKIGIGHGEAKFYIGNKNPETMKFFDDFNRECIFIKSDFVKYLEDAKIEYKNPEQPYVRRSELPSDWEEYKEIVNNLPDEVLGFHIEYQKQIAGPRIYISSDDEVYDILREISLPNVTYLSALKLKEKNGKIIYYFKLFLDYFGEEEHPMIIQNEEKKIEENTGITEVEREQIVKARKGQGKYREAVLQECPFCPITMVSDDRLLIASHIKPWVDSDNQEKTDPKNGFMFTPTYDFLFDRGYISFDDEGIIIISPWLSHMTISKLNLSPGKKYPLLPVIGREKYLDYHRQNILKK